MCCNFRAPSAAERLTELEARFPVTDENSDIGILSKPGTASFSTILYSASGALLCLLGMIPVSRLFPKLPIWACSMIGAVLHNIGQIAAVIVSFGSFTVIGYLPFLMIGGIVSGLFTGLCAHFVIERMKKAGK